MEQIDKRNLDMIVDDAFQSLHILSRHIDKTCRSYLTKASSMVNWDNTVFKSPRWHIW
jgi:hypothetical protein